jgi:bleomycin hydrolase
MRMGKGEHDISEMYEVRKTYQKKAENYIRRQGKTQFGEGGLAHDLIHIVATEGLVPESVFSGKTPNDKIYNHSELEAVMKAILEVYVKQNSKISAHWKQALDGVLDAYFGKAPNSSDTFEYKGKKYTPLSYSESLGLKASDYISLTSFNHHAYYTPFVLEVPDNFSNGLFYNLPLPELMTCIKEAVNKGYTIAWDADVSNDGFSAADGIAIVPKKELSEKIGAEKQVMFKMYEEEKTISPELRQELFDRIITTDDHLMHIVGLAKEKGSNTSFYLVKNSWGEISPFKGYLYASEKYLELNTISVMVHKSAIPKNIAQKLGINN